jgi:hypothetical protein
MTRFFSLLLAATLLVEFACSSPEQVPVVGQSASAEVVQQADPARCHFVGRVIDRKGEALVGLEVTGRVMLRVDERRWQGAGAETVAVGGAGEIEFTVPCGTALSLEFDGWTWAAEPDRLMVDEASSPVTVRLAPERMVLLRLESSPGRRVEGSFTRYASPGTPESTLPVPISGLLIEGVSLGRTSGVIHFPGAAPRPWAISRSHELAEVAPDRFEAVVEVGPEAPVWLTTPPLLLREIEGVWCTSPDRRGVACQRTRGGWLCGCGAEPVLTITSSLWGTALVRQVEDGQVLHLSALPESTKQCFTSEAAVQFQILPQRLATDPLVALQGSTSRGRGPSCFQLPKGERLDILIGENRSSFTVDGKERALPKSG